MEEGLSRRGLFHLCLVYVLWSTTYLAMRVGVGFSSGFPPFMFGALRFPAAALILLGMARMQGLRMKPTPAEWISLCLVGNLLWLGGHGLILWASQFADSGFTCLMASSVPIWAAVIELFLYGKRPSVPLVASLLVGFSGIAILSTPSLGRIETTRIEAIPALVLGALGWALGSAVQSRRPVSLPPLVMSGYHQLTRKLRVPDSILVAGRAAAPSHALGMDSLGIPGSLRLGLCVHFLRDCFEAAAHQRRSDIRLRQSGAGPVPRPARSERADHAEDLARSGTRALQCLCDLQGQANNGPSLFGRMNELSPVRAARPLRQP